MASFCSLALGGWRLTLTQMYRWSCTSICAGRVLGCTLCLCAFSTQCKLGNGRILGLPSPSHLANVHSVIKVAGVEKAPSTRSFQDGGDNRWYSPCCDRSQQAPAPWSTGRKPAGWGMKDAAVAEGLATSSSVQCSAPCRCSIKSLTAQWFRGVHGGHLKARNEVWGSLGLLPSLPFPL